MTRKIFLIEILLIAAALAAAAVAYPHLPTRIPTHWGIRMQPDGYSPRWTVFLFGPGLMAGILLLTWLLPGSHPDTSRSTHSGERTAR